MIERSAAGAILPDAGECRATLDIARATPADAAPLLALQRRAYAAEARLYDDWTIPPLTQSLASLLAEIESATVLKACVGDALVGSVRARLAAQTCLVGRLFVEPQRQRQGIGSALLAAIEAAFASAAVFELFTGCQSEGNIRLYRRHGYAITTTKRLSEQVDIVVMRKPAGGGSQSSS